MVNSLSNDEMKLVTDPQVLITKNRIIQKVYEIFGALAEDYKKILIGGGLTGATEVAAKISRGENYKGLPYVILDYPRQFGKVDVFAIRSFFWWGNFFSITLQLGGQYQDKYGEAIQKAIDKNLFEDWFIGCADDPWQHHFEGDNYVALQQGKHHRFSDLSHLKIAKKIPLDKWDEADCFFKKNFILLTQVLDS